jgi:hypothetical protein
MMFTPSADVKSGGIDEDEFGILLSPEGDFGLVDGGDAVTHRNPLPVNSDHTLGGREIGVPESGRRMGEGSSGRKSCADDPRISADQDGIRISWLSAR